MAHRGWRIRRAVCGVMAAMTIAASSVRNASAEPKPSASELFFKPAQYRSVTLSPVGRLLAAIVPSNGRSNLTRVDLEHRTVDALTVLTDDDVYR